MSDYRPRRIDRDAAERLLDGNADAADAAGPLAAQLLAAAAPAHVGELAGERAALAAFRAAQLDPLPRQRRQSMLKIALAKLLTVKAAAVAATTVGGIALAAGTGVLPTQVSETPASPPVVEESQSKPDDLPTPASDRENASGGNPSPSMVGLCKAYAAQVSENRGKALESPAFSALVTEAGSADEVDGFCEKTTAEAAQAGGAPEELPAPAADARDNAENADSNAQTPASRPEMPTLPTAVPSDPGAPTAPPTPSR